MALSPHKLREILLLLIYSADFGGGEVDDILDLMMGQLSVTRKTIWEAAELRIPFEAKREEIDLLIEKHSSGYDFRRIPRVERAVLRLGVYELLYVDAIPPKVAIAESMRLSRKFATPEAATFVNAILDEIYREKTGESLGSLASIDESLSDATLVSV